MILAVSSSCSQMKYCRWMKRCAWAMSSSRRANLVAPSLKSSTEEAGSTRATFSAEMAREMGSAMSAPHSS